MAVIRTFQRQIRPSGQAPVRTIDARTGGEAQAATARLSDVARQGFDAGLQRVRSGEIAEQRRLEKEAAEAAELERRRQLATDITKRTTDATIEFEDQYAQLRQNAPEGGAGFREGVEGFLDQRIEGMLGEVEGDPEAHFNLSQKLTGIRQRMVLRASTDERAAALSHAENTFSSGMDALSSAAVSNPGELDSYIQQAIAMIDDQSPFMTKEERTQSSQKAKSVLANSAISGLIESDPHSVLEDLQGGRYDGLIDGGDKATAIRKAKASKKRILAEIKAGAAKQADFRTADLELGVRRGELSHADIMNARNEGLFDKKPSKFTQLMNIADGIVEDETEQAEENEALQNKLASGLGLDTQTEADKVWAQRASLLEDDASPIDHVTQFAEDTGFIPTQAKRIIKNADRMANPDQLALSAQMYSSISKAAPGADTGAGDRVKMVSTLVEDAGMSYEDAATQVLSNMPDASVALSRKEELKDQEIDFDEELQDRLELEGFFGGSLTDPVMVGEMERKYKTLYQMSGNQEMALSTAARQLTDKWGASNFRDGSAMRYPPERYIPKSAGNLNGEQFREIVDTEVKQGLEAAGIEGNFRLEADLQDTRKSLAAGGKPIYRVMVENDFGALVPLADENGDIVRYSLPGDKEVAESPLFQSLVAEQEKELGKRGPSSHNPVARSLLHGVGSDAISE